MRLERYESELEIIEDYIKDALVSNGTLKLTVPFVCPQK